MEMNIINTGNSQGIRIPAQLLKQLGINGVVDVEIVNKLIGNKGKTQAKA